MIAVQAKIRNNAIRRQQRLLASLLRKIKNPAPAFQEWTTYYRREIIPASFETQGSLMEGRRWRKLTDKYKKWKKKKGYSNKILIATGYMKASAIRNTKGESNGLNLKVILEGEDYFQYTQNDRVWYKDKDGNPPKRAIQKLIEILDKYIQIEANGVR